MSYDPTQRVPPPQGYPPQQNYPQPNYPPPSYPQQPDYQQPGYTQVQPPVPSTYPQYNSAPPAPAGAGFDFNALWTNLGMAGRIGAISGLVLFISAFIPWFSVNITCTGSLCNTSEKNYSYNAFSLINTVTPPNASESFSFPLMVVVILASLVLIGLPIVEALGKMQARQVQLFMLITAGVALLLEVVYMFSAFGAFPNETGTQTTLDTTVKVAVGPAFGFAIGLLATLAAGGAYLYFGYIKKNPAQGGYPLPYQQVAQQYPGSQPYPPPTQYPGALPYGAPTQYQPPPPPPPPYPGQ